MPAVAPQDDIQALLEQLAEQYEAVNRQAASASQAYLAEDDDSDEW